MFAGKGNNVRPAISGKLAIKAVQEDISSVFSMVKAVYQLSMLLL